MFGVKKQAQSPVAEVIVAKKKAPVQKLFKIKTRYNAIVEGKNKRFAKSFIVVADSKKNALLDFYYDGTNSQYIVVEVTKIDYKEVM
nr:MAG TPA: hypothetical protein [Caudoviricetes sp.]